jgi:hypothetical protein
MVNNKFQNVKELQKYNIHFCYYLVRYELKGYLCVSTNIFISLNSFLNESLYSYKWMNWKSRTIVSDLQKLENTGLKRYFTFVEV